VVMPGVHRISSLLKRWIIGTLQGSISDKHFDYYLDEYTFRFNRRNSNARGLLFYRLLQQAVAIAPVTYKEIVGGQEQVAGPCRNGSEVDTPFIKFVWKCICLHLRVLIPA
jgi:hypothetical protein